MNKGDKFKDIKGSEFDFVGMAGQAIVGKKSNGSCAYMFKATKNGLVGQKIPKSFFSL